MCLPVVTDDVIHTDDVINWTITDGDCPFQRAVTCGRFGGAGHATQVGPIISNPFEKIVVLYW